MELLTPYRWNEMSRRIVVPIPALFFSFLRPACQDPTATIQQRQGKVESGPSTTSLGSRPWFEARDM